MSAKRSSPSAKVATGSSKKKSVLLAPGAGGVQYPGVEGGVALAVGGVVLDDPGEGQGVAFI